MKHFLFLLPIVALSFGAGAQTTTAAAQQYKSVVTAMPSIQPTFTCKVIPVTQTGAEDPSLWMHDDLITWIFPDGQMVQKEIVKTGTTVSNDETVWTPCCNLDVKTNEIQTYIAKKGGTGPPPMVAPLSTDLVTGTASSPIPFPPGKAWKAGSTWEFSPGKDNFLVISYTRLDPCGTDGGDFSVRLPDGLSLVSHQVFNNETISTTTDGRIIIDVPVLGSKSRNVFLKLHTADTVSIGRKFTINVSPLICTDSIQEAVNYIFSAEPHDPNYKIVDLQEIPVGQTDPLKLTYTIQFHNNGEGPVKFVTVIDTLPKELDPASFALVPPPNMNGLQFNSLATSATNKYVKIMTFIGPGLPGLNQKNKSYAFDETIYRFSFTVNSVSNINVPINNDATVLFHKSDGDTLPAVITGIAHVPLASTGPGPDDDQLPKGDGWISNLLIGLLSLLAILGFYFFRRHKTNKP